MADAPITTEDPVAAVTEWFELMSLYCSTVDFDSARGIFAPHVASFGTQADAVRGLDRLQKEQWEQIWPRTKGFRVLMDTVHASGNAGMAWGMATWESMGFDQEGKSFRRPGRATVVLERIGDRWLALHTHFSLYRGVAQETYEPPEAP